MRLTWLTPDGLCEAAPDIIIGVAIEQGEPAAWLTALGCPADNLPGISDARGAKDELCVLHTVNTLPAPRVCLAGLGKKPKKGGGDATRDQLLGVLRAAVGHACVKARELRLARVAFAVDSLRVLGLPVHEGARLVREAVFGALTGLYRYTTLKTTERDQPADPQEFMLVTSKATPVLKDAAERALVEAEAVNMVRDLINTPANLLTPEEFGDKAWDACADLPLTCTVYDAETLQKAGMNAILAVGQGSMNDPVMICLEYAPAGHEDEAPLVLVGKGLIFDSGGISLKPALNMHEMKSDMSGAAAVLGALVIAARLGAPRRVIGLMPCAENMPDAMATRPGDVVRTLSGKTVEIINTDAEGRLVLCDALAYAQKMWKPAIMVDVATLTGACVVALGQQVAGLFATEDALAAQIAALGAAVGDRFWRMPLWDLYLDALKSPVADLSNAGSREGGAASAAIFLKQFVGEGLPWAHLDIAGPAYAAKKTAEYPVGGTGFAVRTLAALALGDAV